MITVRSIVAWDCALTPSGDRILHLRPGDVVDLEPCRDLVLAIRLDRATVVGRPSSADAAALDRIAAGIDVGEGKARMEAAIAAQVRADAAALASASDADIVATVTGQQAPAAPAAQAIAAPRVARAPRSRKPG